MSYFAVLPILTNWTLKTSVQAPSNHCAPDIDPELEMKMNIPGNINSRNNQSAAWNNNNNNTGGGSVVPTTLDILLMTDAVSQ